MLTPLLVKESANWSLVGIQTMSCSIPNSLISLTLAISRAANLLFLFG